MIKFCFPKCMLLLRLTSSHSATLAIRHTLPKTDGTGRASASAHGESVGRLMAAPHDPSEGDATSRELIEDESTDDDVMLSWMYQDSGGLLRPFAKFNPLRWSRPGPPKVVSEELRRASEDAKLVDRPIRLSIGARHDPVLFDSPSEAAHWIDTVGGDRPEVFDFERNAARTRSPLQPFLGTLVQLSAPIALACFCRLHSEQSWLRKNAFVASAYAHRVTNVPKALSTVQRRVGSHRRESASWDEFFSSEDASLVEFIEEATRPADERVPMVEVGGEPFHLLDDFNGNYWCGYIHQATDADSQTTDFMLAFRGGDGGVEDGQHHPGSPARAFVEGANVEEPPPLPLSELRVLIQSLATEKHSDVRVTIVGYSQGGLSALGTAIACSETLTSPGVHCSVRLLNCATMFWPLYFSADGFLPEDWWTRSVDEFAPTVVSYVVRNDPLSEGLSAANLRCPQTPGLTFVLPARFSGNHAIRNHELANFSGNDNDS
jgi:hypothetical protein